MHPVLFHIGTYQVTSYGAALTLAFGLGIWVAHRRAVARGLEGERVLDVTMVILVASLVGSRLFFVVTHLEQFRPPIGTWSDAWNPLQSGGRVGIVGLSMMGGVVLALVAAILAIRWRGLPVLATADVVVPSVALGGGITRIGCFLNGCCHGLVCDLPWGVRFPEGSASAALFPDATVHPTQLYASIGGFALFAFLSWLDRRKLFDGAVLFAFLVASGLGRIALDALRYYEEQVILVRIGDVPITINQAVCLGLVVAGAAGFALLGRRTRAAVS